MKQKGFFPLIFDVFFAVCVFFIVAYLWFSSRLTPRSAMLTSLALSILFAVALSAIVLKRRKQRLYAQAKLAFDEAMLKSLLLMPQKDFLDFCAHLICDLNAYSSRVTLDENEYGFFALQKHGNTALACDEVLACIRQAREMNLGRVRIVTTCPVSSECLDMLKALPVDVELTDGKDLCAIMRERNIFPSVCDTLSVREHDSYRSRIVKALDALLNRQNTVRYLRYAAVMCIGALLTRFNSYFIISAAVFTVLAVLSGVKGLKKANC